MKPTDQQLRDPKWWDENAPEGATHYGINADIWIKYVPEKCACFWDGKWVLYVENLRFERNLGKSAVRPTTPVWNGEGLPPVGCECEAYVFADTVEQGRPLDKWVEGVFEGRIKAPNGGIAGAFKDSDGVLHCINSHSHFRPLRTPEQRQRDDLVNHCIMTIGGSASHEQVAGHMFDIMIANGWGKESE